MIRARLIRRAGAAAAAGGLLGALVIASPVTNAVAGAASSPSTSAPVARTLVHRGSLAGLPAASTGAVGIQSNDPLSVTEEGLYHRRLSPHAAVGVATPSVTSTVIAGATGVAASRQGLNLYQQRSANNGNQFTVVPPDQGLCAGNGFVVETVNDVIRVFNANLQPVTGVLSLNQFLGYPPEIIRGEHPVFGPEPTDPSCYYDPEHNRFVHLALTLEVDEAGNLTGFNHLDISVSRSGDPRGAWELYQLPVQDDGTQGTPVHRDCPCIGDYPHIGADASGVYITTNEYPFSSAPGLFGNNYNGAQLYAIPKAALTSGSSAVPVFQFQNVQLNGTPGFTMWPANASAGRYATADNGTEYFLESVAAEEALGTGSASRLILWSLTNTSSLATAHPSLRLIGRSMASQPYTTPPPSNQQPGAAPLGQCLKWVDCGNAVVGLSDRNTVIPGQVDSLDGRMMQTWYDGNKLWGGWGTGVSVGGTTRAGIAYIVLNVGPTATTVPSVATRGYVANAHNNLVIPAISVLPGGKGVMSMSITGDHYDPSSAFIRIDTTGVHGPVNLVAAGASPLDDFCEYNVFDCAGNVDPPLARPRFGDYSAVVPMGGKLVVANEYVASRCTLETWLNDPTCGESRAPLGNWSTRLTTVTP